MTTAELLNSVPEAIRPAVAQYAPALVQMTATEVWAWVELIVAGKTREAMQAVFDRMPAADLMEAMVSNLAGWDTANAANSQRLALQREAVLAVLRALLTAALSMVGL